MMLPHTHYMLNTKCPLSHKCNKCSLMHHCCAANLNPFTASFLCSLCTCNDTLFNMCLHRHLPSPIPKKAKTLAKTTTTRLPQSLNLILPAMHNPCTFA